MKKQNILYGILSVGCMVQFFAVLVMVLLIPMPPLPASVIAVTSGGVTMALVSVLLRKTEPHGEDSEPLPVQPPLPQEQAVNPILCELKQELRNYQDGTLRICTENDRLKNALKEKEEEIGKYQRSARQLQGWIENFPHEITPQFKLYNLFETEIMTGSYSRWLIPGEENGMLFCVEIIRPDSQNKIELFQMLKNVKTKEDILQLDMAQQMFNPELQSA